MPKTSLTPSDFLAYVASRGYRAEPILNLTVAAEGEPLQVVGYTLRAPRGNKTVVPMDAGGLLPLFDAQLWADGVDYSTRKIQERRA